MILSFKINIKSLKETNDECDNTLQYNLGKYSLAYENALMSDATTISPLNEGIIFNNNYKNLITIIIINYDVDIILLLK